MRKAVAIIPARYASQRFPGKPLADIAGKPMIQHVYEQTNKASLVSNVLVATDDERIASAVGGFGGTAVMTPAALQTGTDRVAHVARTLDESTIVVNVQGDEPLVAPEMIDEGIRIVATSDAVAGTLVKKIDREEDLLDPNVVKVVLDSDCRCLFFSRSPIPYRRDSEHGQWLAGHTYYKHIGLYIFRNAFLQRYTTLAPTPLERAEKLEQLRILEHGHTIRAAVTAYDSVPVDTPDDLKRVRTIYLHQHDQR